GGGGVSERGDLAEAVIGEEVKEFVLDERTAGAAAELLLLLDGLGEVIVGLAEGVEGVERGIAEVVEEVAVEVVAAGFGDGVYLTAGGLAEFGAVGGGSDL